MAYQVWSVVFGEQPSASKWNILGTNDAGFNDGTAIGDDAIIARHIADNAVSNAQMATDTFLWERLARTTLGTAGDTIASGTFTARKYLKILFYVSATGGTVNNRMRFNSDSGANYYERSASNGGADATAASATTLGLTATDSATDRFGEVLVINVQAKEKVIIARINEAGNAGAGNATSRAEANGKWANTSVQITSISLINTGSGDYAIGSELIVLGHD